MCGLFFTPSHPPLCFFLIPYPNLVRTSCMDDPIRMQLGCLSLAPSPLPWTRFRREGLQCLIFAMTQDLGHRHFVSGQWGPLRRCTADLHAGMSWPLLFCPAAVRRERKTGMAPFKRRGSESHLSLCSEICHLPRAFSAEGLRPPGLGKGPSSFQSRLASHADFPPSFRVGELEGGLLYFFSSDLLEIAPVISTIGDEDIFAPAEKYFSFSLFSTIPRLIYGVSTTWRRWRARPRSSPLCARALRIPSKSVTFESPRRTDVSVSVGRRGPFCC